MSEESLAPYRMTLRIEEIIEWVFEKTSDVTNEQVAVLLRKCGYSQWIIHEGVCLRRMSESYLRDNRIRPDKAPPEHHAEASALAREIKATELDIVMVRQGLTILLKPCTSYQDLRDALPNSLRESLAGIKTLPRTREEAWTIRDDPRRLSHWERVRDIIEVNNAIRLCA